MRCGRIEIVPTDFPKCRCCDSRDRIIGNSNVILRGRVESKIGRLLTEGQHIGNQINAAMVFARPDSVKRVQSAAIYLPVELTFILTLCAS